MAKPFFMHAPALAERVATAPRLLVLLDYDGTLTQIVSQPQDANLAPPVKAAMQALHRCTGVSLAVVSGRSLGDVRSRVGLPQLIYAGNHGLEVNAPDFSFVEPTADARRAALESVCADLTAELAGLAGVGVENKGLTATVHFRLAPLESLDRIQRAIQTVAARFAEEFRVTMGHAIYEIRPRVDWNKGAVVKWIEGRLGHAACLSIYLGDDATDEDAFRALPDGITIRVGLPTDTFASYYLPGPAEVLQFLRWLNGVRE